MFKRIRGWWRNRNVSGRVLREMRRKADVPGLEFKVGDRVRPKDVKHADFTAGTVREVGYWHNELQRHQLRVEFDDLPGSLLCMSPSELLFARE